MDTSINWNVEPVPIEINMSGGAKATAGALPEPVPLVGQHTKNLFPFQNLKAPLALTLLEKEELKEIMSKPSRNGNEALRHTKML